MHLYVLNKYIYKKEKSKLRLGAHDTILNDF
jgi:hypothetical protein